MYWVNYHLMRAIPLYPPEFVRPTNEIDNLSFVVDEQALTVDLSKRLGAVSPYLYYPFDGGLTFRY